MMTQSLRHAALFACITLAALATPGFAQDSGGGRGGPVLDNTQSLVSGGALSNRRPGRVVQQGVAAFQANTARVGQIFPLQDVGGGATEEFKFRRELLISVIDTFFNLLNTFISAGSLFGSTGGLGDLGDLLGDLTGSANTVNAESTSTNVSKSAFSPVPGVAPNSRPTSGMLDDAF